MKKCFSSWLFQCRFFSKNKQKKIALNCMQWWFYGSKAFLALQEDAQRISDQYVNFLIVFSNLHTFCWLVATATLVVMASHSYTPLIVLIIIITPTQPARSTDPIPARKHMYGSWGHWHFGGGGEMEDYWKILFLNAQFKSWDNNGKLIKFIQEFLH